MIGNSLGERELMTQYDLLQENQKELFRDPREVDSPWPEEEGKKILHQLAFFNFQNGNISGGRYRECRKLCGLDPWDYERTGA